MTIDVKNIAEMDRNAVLHPFTQLKDFASGKLGEPTIVETGKGIRIQDAHGKQLIDGFAGLYCVNVGYGRTEVAEAISRQAYRLAYYHSYAAHTTDELAILSDRLVRMAPGKMSKVFYGMSGSDANETQAKLVWYYNNLRGKPQKKKIISRERGYHGCTVVSGSMTGMSFITTIWTFHGPASCIQAFRITIGAQKPVRRSWNFRGGARKSWTRLFCAKDRTRLVHSSPSRCSERAVSHRRRKVIGRPFRRFSKIRYPVDCR